MAKAGLQEMVKAVHESKGAKDDCDRKRKARQGCNQDISRRATMEYYFYDGAVGFHNFLSRLKVLMWGSLIKIMNSVLYNT